MRYAWQNRIDVKDQTLIRAADVIGEAMDVFDAVGRSVSFLIPSIVSRCAEIAQVEFVIYRPAPALSDRLSEVLDPAPAIRETATRLHDEFGIPFWDAMFTLAMRSGQIPEAYIDMAILHDADPDERSIRLEARSLSESVMEQLIKNLVPGYGLAFSSRVILKSGQQAHLPLLDFRCPPSAANASSIKRAVAAMGQNEGALVESGRSYHFYGFGPLDQSAWLSFVGRAILFSPIVDTRYLGHRIADGACRLRVAAAFGKTAIPRVVEVF
jgi:hypothetical protein